MTKEELADDIVDLIKEVESVTAGNLIGLLGEDYRGDRYILLEEWNVAIFSGVSQMTVDAIKLLLAEGDRVRLEPIHMPLLFIDESPIPDMPIVLGDPPAEPYAETHFLATHLVLREQEA